MPTGIWPRTSAVTYIAFRTADNCIIEVADPTALQRAADQVTPQLVEHLALRWLSQVPDPLTREERAAGYPLRFSVYQAEFSDNAIFHQTTSSAAPTIASPVTR